MNHKIILINGWAYSGKDTLANYLVKKYNYKKLWFSYPLKNIVSIKYNIPRQLLDTHEGKESLYTGTTKTLRDLLILEAEEIRKNNDAFFAEKLAKKIQNIKSKKIVISDWRFVTEISTLKRLLPEYDIKTIHIARRKNPVINHQSEFILKDFPFDYIVDNSFSLEKLYSFVDVNDKYFF